jgi:short-subunit dehydrogenase
VPVKESYALITGASSGLGVAFARHLAAKGHSLVVVARNEERLQALATELRESYSISCEVLVADLHREADRRVVSDRLADGSRPIDVLVNNAGYGIEGDVDQTTPADEMNHLTIHVVAPLEHIQAALSGMLERGRGTIIVVSSVAGFLARGTYSAHKAWGLSLAGSLTTQYRSRGVVVTAVAPGFTQTEFHQRMGMNVSKVPGLMWLRADYVVRSALRAATRGKAVCVPSLRYKALVMVAALVPKKWHQLGF